MIAEKFYSRFTGLVLLFILSMVLLILRPNLISILFGWDGLGISSYLLVIYYGREKAYNAGILTALTNRLGDGLILFRIGRLVYLGDYTIGWYSKLGVPWLPVFIVLMAAFTKSAQIPFSAWLPAAIAAPTPVSSLVHSSTLVTAGIYLLIRHGQFFLGARVNLFALLTGRLTIVLARIRALNERDMKKIVALSTLRQLGIMVIALGLNCPMLSFLHLILHAFFKAILFIATGNFIHSRTRYQSLRKTGGLFYSMPVSRAGALTAKVRLMGAPFAAAFFSKEPILENIFILNEGSRFRLFLILLGVILTVLYRGRFVVLVILRGRRREALGLKEDEGIKCACAILILYIPSFTSGAFIRNLTTQGPTIYFYPIIIKFRIYFALFLGAALRVILTGGKRNLKYGSHSLLFMWGLPLFSGRLLSFPFIIGGKILVHISSNWVWFLQINFVAWKFRRLELRFGTSSFLYRNLVSVIFPIITFLVWFNNY
jgi:NADH-ubiquinone oxidoreductase chain 5